MQKETVGSKGSRGPEAAAAAPVAESAGTWLPLVALVAAVLAILPPYVDAFGKIDVEQRVEFADHVVPGVAVLVIAVVAYLLMRSPEPSQLLLFVGGAAITLAGLWMVA